MTTRRRKAPAIDAPSTIEEAVALLKRYGDVSASIDTARDGAAEAIRQIEVIRDEAVKPLEEQLKVAFNQLKTWWAVARDSILDGKGKSVLLAGFQIGERTTPPALKLPRGMTEAEAVELLEQLSAPEYVIITTKLSKAALIALLRKPVEERGVWEAAVAEELIRNKISVAQREEFFIARSVKADPDPDVVPDAEEGAVQ